MRCDLFGSAPSSLVITNEVILHFQLKICKFDDDNLKRVVISLDRIRQV